MSNDIDTLKLTLTIDIRTTGLSLWTAIKLRIAGPEYRDKVLSMISEAGHALLDQRAESTAARNSHAWVEAVGRAPNAILEDLPWKPADGTHASKLETKLPDVQHTAIAPITPCQEIVP